MFIISCKSLQLIFKKVKISLTYCSLNQEVVLEHIRQVDVDNVHKPGSLSAQRSKARDRKFFLALKILFKKKKKIKVDST